MEKSLMDMFLLTLPVIEKILRPVVIYLFLVIGLRLAGKRELASLNPLDLVVLLTLSNTVQNAIIGEDNSVTGGLIGAATLLIINYVALRTLYRHPRLNRLIAGGPEVLIDNGVVDQAKLHQQLITPAELEIAANKQGFISLKHVARAEIEPGGAIFFEEKEPSVEHQRYEDILKRLDHLEGMIEALNARRSS